MKTTTLRVNQLSPNVYLQYLAYLQAMDNKDVDAYTAFLGDECILQMNNESPVSGKPAIAGMLAKYWKNFRSIEHELLNIYGADSAYVLEALNHYIRLDGRPVTVRAVAFTDRSSDGLVSSVRLYNDVSALFS